MSQNFSECKITHSVFGDRDDEVNTLGEGNSHGILMHKCREWGNGAE